MHQLHYISSFFSFYICYIPCVEIKIRGFCLIFCWTGVRVGVANTRGDSVAGKRGEWWTWATDMTCLHWKIKCAMGKKRKILPWYLTVHDLGLQYSSQSSSFQHHTWSRKTIASTKLQSAYLWLGTHGGNLKKRKYLQQKNGYKWHESF